jgi:hypothetical protein
MAFILPGVGFARTQLKGFAMGLKGFLVTP